MMSVRLSVRHHVSTLLPLHDFSWNFIPETFKKISRETPQNSIKIGQKYRTSYVKLKSSVSAGEVNSPRNHFCATLSSFYIVDSDVQLNSTHRTHCCFSTVTMITRTCHSVTLRAHCLVFFSPRHTNSPRITRDYAKQHFPLRLLHSIFH